MSFRYCVIATLKDKSVLPEYMKWLNSGHVQAVCDQGGAKTCHVSVLDGSDDTDIRVESAYIFPSFEKYEYYCTEVAPTLRPEGIRLFVDTGLVTKFERVTGKVHFEYP